MHVRRADQMEGRPMEMEGADGVTMRMMVGSDDGAANFATRHFTVRPLQFLCLVPVTFDCGTPTPGS